jgi:hypothetical protein
MRRQLTRVRVPSTNSLHGNTWAPRWAGNRVTYPRSTGSSSMPLGSNGIGIDDGH